MLNRLRRCIRFVRPETLLTEIAKSVQDEYSSTPRFRSSGVVLIRSAHTSHTMTKLATVLNMACNEDSTSVQRFPVIDAEALGTGVEGVSQTLLNTQVTGTGLSRILDDIYAFMNRWRVDLTRKVETYGKFLTLMIVSPQSIYWIRDERTDLIRTSDHDHH